VTRLAAIKKCPSYRAIASNRQTEALASESFFFFSFLLKSLVVRLRGHKQRRLNYHVYPSLWLMSSRPHCQAELSKVAYGALSFVHLVPLSHKHDIFNGFTHEIASVLSSVLGPSSPPGMV